MFRPRIRCRVLSCRDRCRRRNDDFSGEKIRKNINDRLLTPESVRLAAFKRQFTSESYRVFLEEQGFEIVDYQLFDGRVPCQVAEFEIVTGLHLRILICRT